MRAPEEYLEEKRREIAAGPNGEDLNEWILSLVLNAYNQGGLDAIDEIARRAFAADERSAS